MSTSLPKWLKDEDVIADVKNEHGERLIVHKMRGVAELFVTGDELDWEDGWVWDGDRGLKQVFILSDDEAAILKRSLMISPE